MNGQWIGKYSGTNSGDIVINIDAHEGSFRGIAYLNEGDSKLPSSAAVFETKNLNKKFDFEAYIFPINPKTGTADQWVNIRNLYANDVAFPEKAIVKGSWSKNQLQLSWTTSINTHGKCKLTRSDAEKPSKIIPKTLNWAAYKKEVAKLPPRKNLFRGQNEPWRLRTSFHRHGRADLVRFVKEDIPTLHRYLSAKTQHVFNLEIPNENGAFINLVRHHGYPTPLLDWTYSPYVAAFFAYMGITNEQAEKAKADEYVRVYVFAHENWKRDYPQIQQILTSNLHFSIIDFLAIENERMIPQQASSTITNIDDIESYIHDLERNGKIYLKAIDLPVRERPLVIQELQHMGITSGSLFPGFDGTCEEIKQLLFKI